VLDTDVLSAMFKQQLPQRALDLLSERQLGVTYVQVGEVVQWATARNWGAQRAGVLRSWVNRFPVVNGDVAVAETWGEIVAYARKRGRPTPINDSWIAACCIRKKLPLVTGNRRDFADFAAFEGLELIDIGRRKEI
jgi:predicted nucleic acid-binding protein